MKFATLGLLAVATTLVGGCGDDTSLFSETTGTTGATGGSGGTGNGSTGASAGEGGGGSGADGGGAAGGEGGAPGGAGGEGGGGGPVACDWAPDANPCEAGLYCKADDCVSGTCEPLGVETSDKAPVCGCNGITYWNANVAAAAGMASGASGECAELAAVTCGGFGGTPCPADSSCHKKVQNSAGCALADGSGSCWGMPMQCPMPPQVTTQACFAIGCEEECSLIKKEATFHEANNCQD